VNVIKAEATHQGAMPNMELTILRPSLTGPDCEVVGHQIKITPKINMSAEALVDYINRKLKQLGLTSQITARGAVAHGNRALRRVGKRPTR